MALYKSTLRREIVRGKVGKVKLFVICVRVCVYVCVHEPLLTQRTYTVKNQESYLYLQGYIWAISIEYMFLVCPMVKAKTT